MEGVSEPEHFADEFTKKSRSEPEVSFRPLKYMPFSQYIFVSKYAEGQDELIPRISKMSSHLSAGFQKAAQTKITWHYKIVLQTLRTMMMFLWFWLW